MSLWTPFVVVAQTDVCDIPFLIRSPRFSKSTLGRSEVIGPEEAE